MPEELEPDENLEQDAIVPETDEVENDTTEVEIDTEESTTSGEPEAEAEEAKVEEEPKRKRGKNAEQRIKQLIRQKRELEQRLEETNKPAPLVPPDRDTFDDYDEYIAQSASYEARKAVAEDRKARENYEVQKQRQDQTIKFQENLEPARDKYEDFDEVAFDEDLPVSTAMADVLMSSDNAGEVAYYLGKHPEEAARIFDLKSPTAQAAAMGRLEMKISMPKPKQISKAPPPVSARNRGAEKSVDDMTVDEMAEYLK